MKKPAVLVMNFAFILFSPLAWSQAVEVTDQTAVNGNQSESRPSKEPQTGPEAARKYFKNRSADEPVPKRELATDGGRYLDLHLGTFLSEDVYKWGNGRRKNPGQLNFGVTYKMGEWTRSMDLMFKADLTTYQLSEGGATKMSFLPCVSFPDVGSGFPLYFGAGAGLGVFFKQIEDESSLAFDYTIFAGARFFDVINSVGFLIETGMKNHILLLSDGQFNGVYFNLGLVFNF